MRPVHPAEEFRPHHKHSLKVYKMKLERYRILTQPKLRVLVSIPESPNNHETRVDEKTIETIGDHVVM